jgi:glucose/arabinose dehydrogenase
MRKKFYPLALTAACMVFFGANAQTSQLDETIPETDEKPTKSDATTSVFIPGLVDATEDLVGQLNVPQGFKVEVFAKDLKKPRMMATNDMGQTYVTDRENGLVHLLEDTNGDGKADRKEIVLELEEAHGLAIRENKLYIVTLKELFVADIQANGKLGSAKQVDIKLPDGGQHPNRTMAFGPDGKMYISVGSTCNACIEPNPKHATMLRADVDGSNVEIFAEGLRNTIGFGWHPETGEFWGMDHGIDMLGDDEQKEELNLIKEGAHYGWPHIYDDGKYNPYPRPKDKTYEEWKEKSEKPVLLHTAHSAPMAMVFYTGRQFPEAYQGDAFVAFRGSWNRSEPSGYKIGRVKYENGQPKAIEDFLTGFLVEDDKSHFARPVGLTVLKDGSLLLSEDTNGVVYRIHYTGQ